MPRRTAAASDPVLLRPAGASPSDGCAASTSSTLASSEHRSSGWPERRDRRRRRGGLPRARTATGSPTCRSPLLIAAHAASGKVASLLADEADDTFDVIDADEPPRTGFDDVAAAGTADQRRRSSSSAARCFRLHPLGRRPAGARSKAQIADQRAARVRARRLLGADGHVQGPRAPRGPGRERRRCLAGLETEAGAEQPRAGGADARSPRVGERLSVLAIGASRGRHRDRLRRHAPAPRRRACRRSSLTLGRSRVAPRRRAPHEARAGAAAFRGATRDRRGRRSFADGVLPRTGARSRSTFERPEGARRRPTSCSRTTAPTCTRTTGSSPS